VTDLPSGTVTFVFTDLEGSTRLWEQHPDARSEALARHDEIVRGAIEAKRGVVFATMGDGMAAAFASAHDAVSAVLAAQLGLAAAQWGVTGPLRARMGLHTDEGVLSGSEYLNRPLNRCARLMSIAHGGQVVLSSATAAVVAGDLSHPATLLVLGEHRLRDLARPMHVYQLRHPGLMTEFPPLRSLDSFPGNLPIVLTSFVGRERELGSVETAVEQARVVTLIGAGGVGKTRLAVQVAAELLPTYADGVWLCELAAITDRGVVPEAVADCLDARQQPGESATTSVLSFLRNKHLLLVLDNCEHVIESVGSLTEAIAHACPNITVLATSREALGVDGELVRPVGSLAIPPEGAAQADVAAAASVRLFVERAQAVRPDFELDTRTVAAVAEICRQLDGVPLAIELAAARVGSLSANDIARRLDQRFRLLTGGRRTALERHQTLRAAVDWSYDLLDATDALLFNRLAVFAGGFALDAAESVVADERIDTDDVVDVLSRLVARSMVVADESDGEMRYRLLETMRQYARERLDSTGEGDVVRRRHADHYASVVEAVAVGVKGRDEARWAQILDAELPNISAALDWAIGKEDADLAIRIGIAMVARPGRTTAVALERVVNMPAAQYHPLLPRAFGFGGVPSLVESGNLGLATDRLQRMDKLFEAAGLELTAAAHFCHAAVAAVSGDMAATATHGQAAIDRALQDGERYDGAWFAASIAMLFASAGDSDRAVQLADQAHLIGAELSNPTLLALSDTAAGYALSKVNPDAALARLEAGLPILRALKNETLRYTGERCLARLLTARGDLAKACGIYAAVLDQAASDGSVMQIRLTCESLGVDLVAAGYHDDAAILFGALEVPSDTYGGNPFVGRAEAIENLRGVVGPARFDEFAARGRAITVDELSAFAHAVLARIIAEIRQG
jgi:predicted ATPase/class 3 adenylate cyclase